MYDLSTIFLLKFTLPDLSMLIILLPLRVKEEERKQASDQRYQHYHANKICIDIKYSQAITRFCHYTYACGPRLSYTSGILFSRIKAHRT